MFTDKDKSQINYSSNAYSRMYEYNKNLLYFDAINSLENNKNSLHAFHRNKYNNSESKVLNKKNLFVTEKSHRHFFYNKWEHYNKIFLFKYVKNNNRILILNKYINVVFNNLVLKLVYSYICLLYRNKNESKDYVNINSIAYNAIHKMRELRKTVVSVRNNEYHYILSLVEYIKLIEQYNNQILEKAKKEVSINVVNALAETISKKFYKIFLKEKRELYTQLIRININYKPYLLNKSNYNSYLNNLNYIINGVFDKRVILNIIKVKYPILNIELALNTLSNKIRRKRTGLLNIVNKLLALVKLPKHYSTDYNGSDNNNLVSMDWSKFNNQTLLNNHNTMGVNSYKAESVDITNKFIIKLFNLLDTNNRDAENITKGNYRVNLKINEMLSALRYKWIGGMKIEGNGRLTRRYTAARSLSKTKHKGFLKYKDYSPKRISYNMIRGFNKPNIDFSFANSKKRIGAFGIKGWLNSY